MAAPQSQHDPDALTFNVALALAAAAVLLHEGVERENV
jgi:hypothetical protein